MRRVELTGEREVTATGSVGARVRRLTAGAHVVVIEVEPGGVVARHPAGGFQLFAVVSGSGWVSGGEGGREPIASGAGFSVAETLEAEGRWFACLDRS